MYGDQSAEDLIRKENLAIDMNQDLQVGKDLTGIRKKTISSHTKNSEIPVS